MSKKPEVGEFWETRSGERRYVFGINPYGDDYPVRATTVQGRTLSYIRNGNIYAAGESAEDLVTHLPDCDSFGWAPPTLLRFFVFKNHPYYYRVTEDSIFWHNEDGQVVDQKMNPDEMIRSTTWTEVSEEEALKRVANTWPKYAISVHGSLYRADSPTSVVWIDTDGKETVQSDPAYYMKVWDTFRKVTKEEADREIIKKGPKRTPVHLWVSKECLEHGYSYTVAVNNGNLIDTDKYVEILHDGEGLYVNHP